MTDDVEFVWWSEHPVPVWRIWGFRAASVVAFLYGLSAVLLVVAIVTSSLIQAAYAQ